VNQQAINDCFSAGYAQARDKFRARAGECGAAVETHVNPHAQGPSGESLATDVARFGRAEAARVLFVTSATHGVEGFCGSGGQLALMRSGLLDALPADVAVVLVHAINPYGFAHLCRTTESNVDLNRNFVDFSAPLPGNPGYARIHDLLLPADWDGPERLRAEEGIARFIAENGLWAFQCAVSGGQYSHADGLFYGGSEPSWSRETLQSVIAAHAANASHVALVDFHTGLGPYGYGEPISTGTAQEKARARRWYGDEVTDPDAGSSSSAPIQGMLSSAFAQVVPEARAASVALEFGTVPMTETLQALRADNWLRFRGDSASGLARVIKQRIRDTFYCDFDDWRAMIAARGREITGKAIAGLASED